MPVAPLPSPALTTQNIFRHCPKSPGVDPWLRGRFLGMNYRILMGALADLPLLPMGNLSPSRPEWSWSLEINLLPMRPACLLSLCVCFLSSESERSIYSLWPELARLDKNTLRTSLLVGRESWHFLKIPCSSLVLASYSSLFPLRAKATIKWEPNCEAADLPDLGWASSCSGLLFSYPHLEAVGLDNISLWPFSPRILWSYSYFSWLR